ncbi:MAG: ribosome biogenesis GTPase Der, partial [Rhodospirillaceae bacterium]|nr:ribosome biogenesis GTPase Der [Rhodospirillaceae bacterium]
LFSSRAEKIPESYLRYLANGLRDDFGLSGIPLRLMPKKSDNPYADRAK